MKRIRAGCPLPPYMAYPRFLMELPLPETAKLTYVLLLDRARLSMKNPGWTDGWGNVFLYYTIVNLGEALHKSPMTVKKSLAQLEQAGLIERIRQGVGRPNRLYVKLPETENLPPEGQKRNPHRERKLSPNNKEEKERIYEYEEGETL